MGIHIMLILGAVSTLPGILVSAPVLAICFHVAGGFVSTCGYFIFYSKSNPDRSFSAVRA